MTKVTRAGVAAAFASIRRHMTITGMLECPALAKELGIKRAFIKYEGNTPTGSFKVRGALYLASKQQPGTKLYTHSSGNWAMGIAWAGRAYNLPVVVYMKPSASELKKSKTLSFGAEVREIDGQPDQMTAIVTEHASQQGGIFVSPYDHPLIIEGHATCGTEIHHAFKAVGLSLDNVILPVSGGGLAAGVAFAVQDHTNHKSNVICVEPEGCNDFQLSLAARTRTPIATPRVSIADGLLANQVGVSNWPVLQNNVNSSVTVCDKTMQMAMRFIFEELGIMAEPSGAITVAAALEKQLSLQGDNAVFVVSGRNISTQDFLIHAGYKRRR